MRYIWGRTKSKQSFAESEVNIHEYLPGLRWGKLDYGVKKKNRRTEQAECGLGRAECTLSSHLVPVHRDIVFMQF